MFHVRRNDMCHKDMGFAGRSENVYILALANIKHMSL